MSELLLLLTLNMSPVQKIFTERCAMCHNANWPTKDWTNPKVADAHKKEIFSRTVVLKDMPPSNITNMTEEERKVIAKWAKEK